MTPQKSRRRQPASSSHGLPRSPIAARRVDSVSAGPISVLVLFFLRSPSIAAFEAGAGCGARQLASRWSAGRRWALRRGLAPRDPHPPRSAFGSRNLGADRPIARPVKGSDRKLPGASRRSNPSFSRGRKSLSPRRRGRERAGPAARKSEVAGQHGVGYAVLDSSCNERRLGGCVGAKRVRSSLHNHS
jgi:hypothetical protein